MKINAVNKVVTFSLFLLIIFAQSQAQEVSFGGKIGGNYATVIGDNSSSYDPATALMVGVMAEIIITKKFSAQPEIVFSRQGFNSDALSLKVNYTNLPFIAKYYLVKGLSLEAGPQIGFTTIAVATTPVGKYDARDRIKPIDLGVCGGIGYKLESGLNFGARINYGLSNINHYVGERVSNQNMVFQAYVGLFIF